MSSTLIAEINDLINHGKFRVAMQLAQMNADNAEVNQSAHFYFQWGLAVQLCGDDASALWEKAKRCDDYTSTMAGDFYRDRSLAALRRRDLTQAKRMLDFALGYHRSDINRIAADVMVKARIELAQGDYETAYLFHKQADTMWKSIDKQADKQWIRNNNFHWFKAIVGIRRDNEWLYAIIMADEPRRDRRIRVWSMKHFGRVGLRLDAIAEKLIF